MVEELPLVHVWKHLFMNRHLPLCTGQWLSLISQSLQVRLEAPRLGLRSAQALWGPLRALWVSLLSLAIRNSSPLPRQAPHQNGFLETPLKFQLFAFLQKKGNLAQSKFECNWKQNSFMITIFHSLFSPVQILLLRGKVGCKDLYYVYLISNFCKRKINSITCGDVSCQE